VWVEADPTVGEEQMAADSAVALRPVRAIRLDLTLGLFEFWPWHEVMLAAHTIEFKHAHDRRRASKHVGEQISTSALSDPLAGRRRGDRRDGPRACGCSSIRRVS
jgi:hypothetical protein